MKDPPNQFFNLEINDRRRYCKFEDAVKAEAGIGGRAGPYRLDVGQELVMLTEAWKIETYVSTQGKYFGMKEGHVSTCFLKSNTNSQLTHGRSANRSY